MERVELTLYLLRLAQRHCLFLFAGERVGFKFKCMYFHTHPFPYLPHGVGLAAYGYNPRESVLDMLLCRYHTVKFLVGKLLRFFFIFGHSGVLKGAAALKLPPLVVWIVMGYAPVAKFTEILSAYITVLRFSVLQSCALAVDFSTNSLPSVLRLVIIRAFG